MSLDDIEVIELQDAALEKSVWSPKKGGKRLFTIRGTFEESLAFTKFALVLPETIPSSNDGELLFLDKANVKTREADIWDGEAYYISLELKEEKEQKEKERNPPEDGVVWDFDTTGGTTHITTSYGTRAWGQFGAPNGEPFNAYGNAINVKRTKTGFDVKGIDKPIPKLEITATVAFAPGKVNLAFIKTLARVTGKKNLNVWGGFDAGELLFMGARIKAKRWDKTIIVYLFSASENINVAHGVKVGDIGPIEAGGHDYVWVEYENVDDGVTIFPKPRYVFVETIHLATDFQILGIGT